ncbi:MAG: class I SAM-dependent methyltransferase [Dehalococcoidia bacterium]
MRFQFGKNWQSFSRSALNEDKINQARNDFLALFSDIDLKGKRFFDIGFGQGLTLLLAGEAGANVYGIDIDADNLSALSETKKFFPAIEMPDTEVVSILDNNFIERQIKSGGYDVVHSWGVLHHTGNMEQAIKNATKLTKDRGFLIISIYNKHWSSPLWRCIKWTYNKAPNVMRCAMLRALYPIVYTAKWCVTRRNPKKHKRGMDFWHNLVDWVGGYPYEYATPQAVQKSVCDLGFTVVKYTPAAVPTGCNEFVFQKKAS